MNTKTTAYIEIVATVATLRFNLDASDLYFIGEFTRENVARWLDSRGAPFEVGVYGWEDFHAVCGDIDIPWATEEGKGYASDFKKRA